MKCRNALTGLFLAMILLVGVGQVQAAATFTHDYSLDGATEGFNSTAAANAESTAAGNPGANLGAQRRASNEAAAARWGAAFNSAVTTRVQSKMDDQGDCAGGTFQLGSAGPEGVYKDTAGLPATTWFPSALANKIAGATVNAVNTQEINATYNSTLDTAGNCSNARWFYALDNRVAPAGFVAFFPTVLHELAHGLCVSAFFDPTDGTLFADANGPGVAPPGEDDYFTRFIEHHGVGMLSGLTDAQRLTSVTADPSLHWVSNTVQTMLAGVNLGGGVDNGHPQLYAPAVFAGGSSVSHWDEDFIQNVTAKHEFMEPIGDDITGDLLTRYMCQDIGWGALNQAIPVQLQEFSVD